MLDPDSFMYMYAWYIFPLQEDFNSSDMHLNSVGKHYHNKVLAVSADPSPVSHIPAS
jgi:hypothetical protein